MGFPLSMFTVLFSVARTVGWITNWREMIVDPNHKIGRPRQLCTSSLIHLSSIPILTLTRILDVGPKEREFVSPESRPLSPTSTKLLEEQSKAEEALISRGTSVRRVSVNFKFPIA